MHCTIDRKRRQPWQQREHPDAGLREAALNHADRVFANAVAWAGGDNTSRAECHATVDPTIYLDQAAFDAKYGAESFLLSDYYTLQFSDNVGVVPLPAVVWLFSSGLLGLIAVGRRKAA